MKQIKFFKFFVILIIISIKNFLIFQKTNIRFCTFKYHEKLTVFLSYGKIFVFWGEKIKKLKDQI